jgi:hypothetical protein
MALVSQILHANDTPFVRFGPVNLGDVGLRHVPQGQSALFVAGQEKDFRVALSIHYNRLTKREKVQN